MDLVRCSSAFYILHSVLPTEACRAQTDKAQMDVPLSMSACGLRNLASRLQLNTAMRSVSDGTGPGLEM